MLLLPQYWSRCPRLIQTSVCVKRWRETQMHTEPNPSWLWLYQAGNLRLVLHFSSSSTICFLSTFKFENHWVCTWESDENLYLDKVFWLVIVSNGFWPSALFVTKKTCTPTHTNVFIYLLYILYTYTRILLYHGYYKTNANLIFKCWINIHMTKTLIFPPCTSGPAVSSLGHMHLLEYSKHHKICFWKRHVDCNIRAGTAGHK